MGGLLSQVALLRSQSCLSPGDVTDSTMLPPARDVQQVLKIDCFFLSILIDSKIAFCF